MDLQRKIGRLIFASLLSITAVPAMAQAALDEKMQEQIRQLNQLDQLDQMDHMEFLEHVEYADSCTRARHFDCAEKSIAKAAKGAGNPRDKKALLAAKQRLVAERNAEYQERVAEEKRLKQLAEREERRREEARAAERRREEREEAERNKRAAVALVVGTMVGNSTRNYTPEQRDRVVRASMESVMTGDTSRMDAASNQVMAERQQSHNAQMQAIREQRFREESAARARAQAQREEQARAAQRRREAERENSARADAERTGVAQMGRATGSVQMAAAPNGQSLSGGSGSTSQAQLLQQEAQRKSAEESRRKEMEKAAAEKAAAEKAAAEKVAAEKAVAEKARREKIEADKKAQAEAKAQAEGEYLRKLAAGTRLVAQNCFGEHHVMGKLPSIKPRLVECVDVQFRAYCPGTPPVYHQGVIKNMVGMGTGCYGDTAQIEPKLACKATEITVEVVEARGCKW
jgi:hypothetical protein